MRCRWVIVLIFLLVSRSSAAYEIVPVDRIHGNRGLGLSADGHVVVGSDPSDPFRWTREGGAVNLGDLAGYQITSVGSEGARRSAGPRPPLKPDVQFSRIRLSQRHVIDVG